jgi:hypothetical protein
LQKVTAPALRLQLVKEIAELARVSQEEAEGLMDMQSSTPAFRRAAPARTAAPIASSQERHLLRCVIARPALAAELAEELLDPELPETGALRAIAQLPLEAHLNGAVLVERFQGTEHEQIVFQTMASSMGENEGDGEDAASEFRQIQLALRIKQVHREVEALNRDAARDPALRPELQRRLLELSQLKTQRS